MINNIEELTTEYRIFVQIKERFAWIPCKYMYVQEGTLQTVIKPWEDSCTKTRGVHVGNFAKNPSDVPTEDSVSL